MRNKVYASNIINDANTKNFISSNYKTGKNLKDFIPHNLASIRVNNPIIKNENFSIKKQRDYLPPYEPNEIFPEWPSEEEVEVKLFFNFGL